MSGLVDVACACDDLDRHGRERIIVLRYDEDQRGWLDPARMALVAAICNGRQYPYTHLQIFGAKGLKVCHDLTGNEGSARPLVLHDLVRALVSNSKLQLQTNEVCDHV